MAGPFELVGGFAGGWAGGEAGAFAGGAAGTLVEPIGGTLVGGVVGGVVGRKVGAAAGRSLGAWADNKLGLGDQSLCGGNCAASEKADDDKKKKTIEVSKEKYPDSAKHIDDAQADGQPADVTIDRSGAADNRAESLDGEPSPSSGMDRDEYPPAVAQEGGEGSSVREIPSSDNRGAGASMGNQMRSLPDGTTVTIKTTK